MSARTFAVSIGALAVIGLLGFGLLTKGEARLETGAEFPDAELPTLSGEGSGSLADYRGKWVLVNVWASWCDPCKEESPALQAFHEEHQGDDFTVLGIASRDVSSEALEFVDEYGLTYPQLHDGEGERPDEYGMTGFPESFLVDPEGKLALTCIGAIDEQDLEQLIEPRIEGDAAPEGRCPGGAA